MSFLQGDLKLINKLTAIIVVMIFVVSLVSCGSEETSQQTSTIQSPSATPDYKIEVKKLETREAELQKAMENPPVDLDLVYELAAVRADLAKEAYGRGEEALALDLLTNSLSIDPMQPDCWERLGDWTLEIGLADSQSMAFYAYSQAVDLRPKLPRTLMKLAVLTSGFGKWDDAISQVEQALESPQTINPEWTHLTFLVQLYIRAEQSGQGMAFLNSRFEETYDDRYLLALATLMDGLGQGEPAARIAASVAKRTTLPETLRIYAERITARFKDAGNSRIYGKSKADKSWRVTP